MNVLNSSITVLYIIPYTYLIGMSIVNSSLFKNTFSKIKNTMSNCKCGVCEYQIKK